MITTTDDRTLEETFLASRVELLAFLQSRGGAAGAEDIFHEMWLRLRKVQMEGIAIGAPLSYFYRMANSIMIDRHRQDSQAQRREFDWADAHDAVRDWSDRPTVDREMEARQMLDKVVALLDAESERARRAFWMHRIDGLTQREVAVQLRVSVATVEADLRKVYRHLAKARTLWDKAVAR
jgi:RNA polymerase sigma-70 factor (ECF subfamily)